MQLDRAGRAGFSLMELMVVIVMAGILASMAVSRINVTKLKVNSEVRNMASTLTYAQRLAISLQSDVRVAFDVPNNRVRILEDQNNNGIADAGERVRVVALDNGVIFGRASAPVIPGIGAGAVSFTRTLGGLPAAIFHRDGSSAEAGGFYITSARSVAASMAIETRAVDITRATSRVTRYSYASNTAWKVEN